MSELPPGWVTVGLRDLLVHTIGGVWGGEPGSDEADVDVIRVTEMAADGRLDPSTAARRSISERQLGSRMLLADDLLLEKSGGGPRRPVGRVGRVTAPKGPSVCANFMQLMRVDRSLVTPRFVEHFLRYFHDQGGTEPLQTATTNIRNLKTKDYLRTPVPLPPSGEQERIVAAIEEHLSRLDAAAHALRSSDRRMAALQQRVVDAAIEGEIVDLGELLREPLRNGLSARASADGSIRVVTLTAVTQSAFIDGNSKLIEPSARPMDDLWMRPGDIFIQRSNTPELVGTAALFDGPAEWAIFPDLLIRVRVDSDRVDPGYLALVLRSTALRRYFQRSAQGIAGSMPKISQPVVEAAPIPLPTIERQRGILGKVNVETETAGRLALEARRAGRRANSLRRSILAAAFSGQLVAQDPDDEPAAVLLDRIRAERAAATSNKGTRKAKAS